MPDPSPRTQTVQAFAAQGAPPGFQAYLPTFHGDLRVGYIREGPDGWWAVCPDANAGFGLSFAVAPSHLLNLVPLES